MTDSLLGPLEVEEMLASQVVAEMRQDQAAADLPLAFENAMDVGQLILAVDQVNMVYLAIGLIAETASLDVLVVVALLGNRQIQDLRRRAFVHHFV